MFSRANSRIKVLAQVLSSGRLLLRCHQSILGEVHFTFKTFHFHSVSYVERHLPWKYLCFVHGLCQLRAGSAITEKGHRKGSKFFSYWRRFSQIRVSWLVSYFYCSFPFLGLMYLRMIFLGNSWWTVFLLSYFSPATGNAESSVFGQMGFFR